MLEHITVAHILSAVGALTAVWGLFKAARWFVHKMDAIEEATVSVTTAAKMIQHELGEMNGGRLTRPLDAEGLKSATIKEMMADSRVTLLGVRTLLIEQRDVLAASDAKAAERGREIIAELRKTNA